MECEFEFTVIKHLYRCKHCGFEHSEDGNHSPQQIHRTCPKLSHQKVKAPTRVRKALNLSKATAKFIYAKGKTVTEAQFEHRLKICDGCKQRDGNNCLMCGCALAGEKIAKARWASEECPLGKWPKLKRYRSKEAMSDLLFYGDCLPARLQGIYRNATCFFIGGGPSLLTQQEQLRILSLQRGFLTCAVNNVAANIIHPNLWVSVDDPKSFCENIYKDPTILKFVAEENYNKRYMEIVDGHRQTSRALVSESPCTWYFPRNKEFNPKTFLTENSVNWGNHADVADDDGNKGGRTVMFAAIRILFYLGIRRVYLLGCDFNMDENKPYAFNQTKHRGGCATNNQMYRAANDRFTALRPLFESNNFHVRNCTPGSKLTAFDNITLEDAIKSVRDKFPQKVDTAEMYGK